MRWSLIVAAVLLSACSGGESTDAVVTTTPETVAAPSSTTTAAALPATTTTDSGEGCAHVVDATITNDGGTFTIAATVSSADTGWDKYADAWQVWNAEGEVLAERVLTHPHENEQPFTRSLSEVVIPEDLTAVTIAAGDSVLGYCGDRFVLEVPGR